MNGLPIRCLATLALLAALPGAQNVTKVSGPLAAADERGTVADFRTVAGGELVLYRATESRGAEHIAPESGFELYVVPSNGCRLSQRLHPPILHWQGELERPGVGKAYAATADGRFALFSVQGNEPEAFLYLASLDLAGPVVPIGDELAGEVAEIVASPDPNVFAILARDRPWIGTVDPPTLAPAFEVTDNFPRHDSLRFSEDGRWLFFRTGPGSIVRVPTAAPLEREIVLGGPGTGIGALEFGLIGDRLVVLATTAPGVDELFVLDAVADTPQVRRLHPPALPGRGVTDFALHPAGQDVAFVFDGRLGVRSLAANDPGRLLDTGLASATLSELVFTPTGDALLFLHRSRGRGLVSVPFDGATPPVRLSPNEAWVTRFTVAPDGRRTAYALASGAVDAADLDGSSQRRLAHVSSGRIDSLAIDAGGRGVLFRQVDATSENFDGTSLPSTVTRLFAVPLDGAAPAREVDESRLAGSTSGTSRLVPGRRALFLSEADGGGRELRSANVGTGAPSQVLNTPLSNLVEGRVGRFRLSPDSRWCVYEVEATTRGLYELWSTPVDRSGPARPLGGAAPSWSLSDWRITRDSRNVLFLQPTSEGEQVWMAPIDGGSEARDLGVTPFPNFLQVSSDPRLSDYAFVARGSTRGFVVRLSTGETREIGRDAVFWDPFVLTRQLVSLDRYRYQIHRLDVDQPVEVSQALESVDRWWVDPQQRFLLARTGDRIRRVDARTGGTRILASAVFGSVEPVLTPDGNGLFVVRAEGGNSSLFYVASDGLTHPRRLFTSATSAAFWDIQPWPDSQGAVFSIRFVLRSVSLETSEVRVLTPPSPPGRIRSFQLAEDRVFFGGELLELGRTDWLSNSYDGDELELVLPDIELPLFFLGPALSLDRKLLLFSLGRHPLKGDGFELFSLPVDGSRGLLRESAPMAPGRGLANWWWSGTTLVYLADQEADEVFELFRTDLRPPEAFEAVPVR